MAPGRKFSSTTSAVRARPWTSFEVEHDAALVAVHDGEEANAGASQGAGLVAVGCWLDLDDVGAKIGQYQTC
jgi:hypothetical protein